ncbi:MAG: PAS domain S-box protein [Bacteroidetes bacterium]|nr:PAS domain S-box protein [Bacteroidota bacterium]MBU2376749.1 PAS domain S-box protein [Bacteroidota bacterium]
MTIKNIPIQRILVALFLLLVVAIFLNRYIENNKVKKNADFVIKTLNRTQRKNSSIIQLKDGIDDIQINLLRYLFYKNEERKEIALTALQKGIREIPSNLYEYRKIINDKVELQIYNQLLKDINIYLKHATALQSLIKAKKMNKASEFNSSVVYHDYHLTKNSINKYFRYLYQAENKEISQAQVDLNQRQDMGYYFTIIFTVFLICLGLVISESITQKNKINKELSKSEKRYKALIEHTTDILETADSNGKLISVNRSFKDKLGYNEEDLKNLYLIDIMAPESIDTFVPHPKKEEFGEIITGIKKTLMTKSGKKILVEGNILLDFEGDHFSGSSAYYNDVTEKTLMQRKLVHSELKYRNLFNLSPFANWLINPTNLKIEQFNQEVLVRYGYTKAELNKMNLADLHLPEDKERIQQMIHQALLNEVTKYEIKQQKKDETLIDVEFYTTRILLDDDIESVLVVCKDVSEEKFYKNSLEAQNKRLKDIAWTQSHIVRAPLARMMGLMSLIEHESTTLTEKEEMLQYLSSSTHELDQVISHIVKTTHEV